MIRSTARLHHEPTPTSFWSEWDRWDRSSRPIFAKAGLKVTAFEPGPFRTQADYLPDELGAAYYCRANMGPKFCQRNSALAAERR